MQETVSRLDEDLTDHKAASKEHVQISASAIAGLEDKISNVQVPEQAPVKFSLVEKSLARLEEGFEEISVVVQSLQEELQEHSTMAAAAAAWPSDVEAVESRLTKAMDELKQTVSDTKSVEAMESRLNTAMDELRQTVSDTQSVAKATNERYEQMSQKMAEVAAKSMAIAETVQSEHSDLSSKVESSSRQLQDQNDHLDAKIDALSVMLKLAGINAGYESKSTAACSDDTDMDASGAGEDAGTPTSHMSNADRGVVAELAGKVKLLERTQAGHEMSLANCEAAIQLAASKESVTELSDRITSESQAQTGACAKLKKDITRVSKTNHSSKRSPPCLFNCPPTDCFICGPTDKRPI
jgi:phage regulator Rha-like protein